LRSSPVLLFISALNAQLADRGFLLALLLSFIQGVNVLAQQVPRKRLELF
jgi:hypothetical protein